MNLEPNDLTPDENSVTIDVEGSGPDAIAEHFEGTPREETFTGFFDSNVVNIPPQWTAGAYAAMRVQQEENDEALKRLAADGITVQVPSVDMLKFGVLLDMLLGQLDDSQDGPRSPQRVAYELSVQRVIAKQLENAAGQSARAKLLAPGMPHPVRGGHPGRNGAGLIMPGG